MDTEDKPKVEMTMVRLPQGSRARMKKLLRKDERVSAFIRNAIQEEMAYREEMRRLLRQPKAG